MIYTQLLQKAIRFSTKVHEVDDKQKRKGKDIPYITHPLTVGLILTRVTIDEDVIAAGILHDTIEDCKPYGSVTEALLTKEFNEHIARMVNDITEKDKSLPWMERKLNALKEIKHMNHDSLLVKSADVLHNLSELNEDIQNEGLAVFKKFNASKDDTLTRHIKLIPEIQSTWPQNPLLEDLQHALKVLLKISHTNI